MKDSCRRLNSRWLATLVLLLAFYGEAMLEQPPEIVMLEVSNLSQMFVNSVLAYRLNRRGCECRSMACRPALFARDRLT